MQNPQNPQNPYQSPIASPTGEINSPFSGGSMMPPGANNSGMGAQSVLPDELKGINGGAFFLNWVWGIAHSTWWALLCFVPYVGIVMSFVLLFKGNEWAWQNRRWDSVQQFRDVQRKWLIWGVVLFALSVILGFLSFAMLASLRASNPGAFVPRTIPSR